jgi:outer membrane protein TolC
MRWRLLFRFRALAFTCAGSITLACGPAWAQGLILPPPQHTAPMPTPSAKPPAGPAATIPALPPPGSPSRPFQINLPAALKLADATPLDIAVAAERLQAAAAQLQRANVLWLPSISVGVDYFRHDGQIQDVAGPVFTTSKSSFMVGASPNAVFALTDAIYSPLAARQVVRAREAGVQAARNDSLLAVAEAYFNVQQARGDLAGAADSAQRAEDLAGRVEKLAKGLSPEVEANRARAELARRRQAVESAAERWQTAAAELNRLLRLDPAALVEPVEEPQLRVELIDVRRTADELIPVALTNRPELAADQALVQATLARLRQEKVRPLVPSVLLRGAATNPAGTLSGGYFGGGVNGDLSNFGARNSYDVQVIWELPNLGFGYRAAVRERESENRLALVELFRTQDRVAAEVVQALAQAQRASRRIGQAEEEVKEALQTVEKSVIGVATTRTVGVGETPLLVFRPQEVVAAIQSLDLAYRDYYGAVADFNRPQFRLYRALGHPAQGVLREQPAPPAMARGQISPAKPDRAASKPKTPPATLGRPAAPLQ